MRHLKKRYSRQRSLFAAYGAVAVGIAAGAFAGWRLLARRQAAAESERQPADGPRVNPADPVEEASYESFPASDPPAFSSSVTGSHSATVGNGSENSH